MIEYFHIQNYGCIRALTLSLHYAEGKAPNGFQESPIVPFIQVGKTTGDRVCPVLAIYGPNASGKTTILKAIKLLKDLVCNGYFPRAYQPNLVTNKTFDQNATILGITFWLHTKRYHYELRFNQHSFCGERLSVNHQCVYEVTPDQKLLLGKDFTSHCEEVKNAFELHYAASQNQRHTKTFLQVLAQSLPAANTTITEVFHYLTHSIITLPKRISAIDGIKSLAQTIPENPKEKEKEALQLLLKYLHKLDIPIVNLKLDENIEFPIHLKIAQKNSDGSEVWLPLSRSSKSSRRLVGLVAYLLAAIRNGSTLCIDGMDASIHSLLFIELVRLFKLKTSNLSGAQLICSCYNTDLLASDLLSMSEVCVIARRAPQGTMVTRLTDIPGLRNADNFRRRYLRGEFGGIPFPYV